MSKSLLTEYITISAVFEREFVPVPMTTCSVDVYVLSVIGRFAGAYFCQEWQVSNLSAPAASNISSNTEFSSLSMLKD